MSLRLSEGDVDDELNRCPERLRLFFFRAWASLDELYPSPGADPSKLARWREAPGWSPEGRKAADFGRSVNMLAFWLGGTDLHI